MFGLCLEFLCDQCQQLFGQFVFGGGWEYLFIVLLEGCGGIVVVFEIIVIDVDLVGDYQVQVFVDQFVVCIFFYVVGFGGEVDYQFQ